ncbi:MAG: cyclophilin family peptidyl-prolyl cis-trans isomerase [Halieaceae bacterium]|jgi:cyclophilin family peptidyl-prolyl cis-trans isomerase
MRILKPLLYLLFFMTLASCRIIQQPSVGGDIISSSGTMDCLVGECIVPVSGVLDQTFTARPHAGFEFVTWKILCSHQPSAVCDLLVPADFTLHDIDVQQVALFAPTPTDNLATERLVFETNYGYIVLELFGDLSPITVENFVTYVDAGFYSGTIIHRVFSGGINGIQGGGFGWDPEAGEYPTSGLYSKVTGDPIENESFNGLSNIPGTIAMARTTAPDSATGQFFFNFGDNSQLDYVSDAQDGYAVFGRVVTGSEIIETIYNLELFTNFNSPFGDLPTVPVIINNITRHPMPETQ